MNEVYPRFSQKELASPDTGDHHMDPEFMAIVLNIREEYNKPMIVTSGYRSPEHNASVSSTGRTGPHTTGRAIDVLVCGADALDLIDHAMLNGITGIGIKQHGPHKDRFIHLDDLPDAPRQPRPWIWSYGA